jgi:hypothetical protein
LYYEAGLALRQGTPLYESPLELISDSASIFYYAPIMGALFVPFTFLDPVTAGHSFNFLSISLVVISLYHLTTVVLNPERAWVAFSVALGILLFYPSWAWIQNGQITGLVVASIAFGGARLLYTETKGGAWLSIGPAIKLFYLPVGAPLLWSGKALARAFFACIGILLASIGLVGFESFVQWLELIWGGKGWTGQWRHIHTYRPFGFLGHYAIVPKLILVVIAALLTFLKRGSSWPNQAWAFVLGCTTAALAVPAPLLYNSVITYPAFIVAGGITYRRGSRYLVPVLMTLILVHFQPLLFDLVINRLAAMNTINHRSALIIIQPAQWALLVLYVVAVTRLMTFDSSDRSTKHSIV